MIYKWKENAPVTFPVEAQIAGETIEALEKIHGEVTAKLLLDSSRDEKAPLHKCFNWNDTEAAEKYREIQAKKLINFIVIEVPKADSEENQTVRAFVNVAPQPVKRHGQFMSTVVAMADETLRDRILKTALMELKAFQKKYSSFQELSEVFSAINDIIKKRGGEKIE